MIAITAYEVYGLTPETPVGPWVRWGYDLLSRLPGSQWTLEQGESPGGRYLRSYAPADVSEELRRLARSRGDLCLVPRTWDAESELPPATVGVLRFPGLPGPPLADLPELPELPGRLRTPWAVQGVLLGGDPPEGQLRVAAFGPVREARLVLQSVLFAWGPALGGIPEPWEPGSRAHRIAQGEWRRRELRRFHGGPAPGMPRERWSRPWSAPAAWDGGTLPPASAPRPPALPWATGWGKGEGWSPDEATLLRHVLVLGLTGSGKTQLLAHGAAEVHRRRVPLVALDMHGDLTPALLERLSDRPEEEFLLVGPGPGEGGMDVLAPPTADGSAVRVAGSRVVGELLGALRPAGALRDDLWGPRMERLLEGGLRCVLGTGGTLYDLARLYHDPFGEAATLRPLLPDRILREFLDELVSLHRRQPDFLASVQNRLARVLFDPTLRALVAPRSRGLDPEEALGQRRSILLHLPKGVLGEAGGLFVAHLLLARCYLALLRREAPGEDRLRALFVLDEAHLLSPRLLGTMVREGRKFGVGLLLATQGGPATPGGGEEGTWSEVGTVFALRMAPGPARQFLPWLAPRLPLHAGSPAAAELTGALVRLPRHAAYLRRVGEDLPRLVVLPGPVARAHARTAPTGPGSPFPDPEPGASSPTEFADEETEGLLALLADRVPSDPKPAWWREGERRAFFRELAPGKFQLTEAGWGRLGWRRETGAPRESFEHRRLLRDVYALFAYRGIALEMPRQGGFDQRLPDARWVRTTAPNGGGDPPRLRTDLFDRTRELHVEVEVSALEDPRRLARSWEKAQAQGAHLLWVAGTRWGGERLRAFLRRKRAGPQQATVWVLREEALRGWRERHPGPGSGT